MTPTLKEAFRKSEIDFSFFEKKGGWDRVVIQKFIAQIRRAFEWSSPKPIFNVKQVGGVWKPGTIKRLDTEIIPQIFYPAPRLEDFMSANFQREMNEEIAKNPIVLTGKAHLRFKLRDGSYTTISNVNWRVEVYRILKLEMGRDGSIAITQYKARSRFLRLK